MNKKLQLQTLINVIQGLDTIWIRGSDAAAIAGIRHALQQVALAIKDETRPSPQEEHLAEFNQWLEKTKGGKILEEFSSLVKSKSQTA